MKGLYIVIGLLVFILNSNPASAWSYWYYTPIPYYGPVQTQYMTVPGLFMYNQVPYGQFQAWDMTFPMPSSAIHVEQMQFPTEYRFRVYPGNQRLQDIEISFEEGALVVRNEVQPHPRQEGPHFMQQFGGSTQWMLLPVDANMDAMRWSINNGALEIIIPKLR